jgi:hypothetical protein
MPWFCTQLEKLISGFGDTLSQFFFSHVKEIQQCNNQKQNKTKKPKGISIFFDVCDTIQCVKIIFVNPIINLTHELTLKSVAKFMFITHSIWPHNLFRSNVVPILLHTNHCNILNFHNNVCDCVALNNCSWTLHK